MADCASLLDEELSSFVFNYLTENSGSQYGEEEVSSDRLDADFPDIDLSQLDASDFNCLSELHWCTDQSGSSPDSSQYNAGDPEFFEIEEENAALLAALTDSLDGMVEDEVGGLSVFPSLADGPEDDEDDVDEDARQDRFCPSELQHEQRPLVDTELFGSSPGSEPEDPSLLKKLLLTPPNVPVGLDSHKEARLHRHSSRNHHLKPVRPPLRLQTTKALRSVSPGRSVRLAVSAQSCTVT